MILNFILEVTINLFKIRCVVGLKYKYWLQVNGEIIRVIPRVIKENIHSKVFKAEIALSFHSVEFDRVVTGEAYLAVTVNQLALQRKLEDRHY